MQVQSVIPLLQSTTKATGAELLPSLASITPEQAKAPGAAAQPVVLPIVEKAESQLFTQHYVQNTMGSGLYYEKTNTALKAYLSTMASAEEREVDIYA